MDLITFISPVYRDFIRNTYKVTVKDCVELVEKYPVE